MFPRKFVKDHKFDVTNHNAIVFHTEQKKADIIDKIMKMGIASFVTPDNPQAGAYGNQFKDSRISGLPQYIASAGCCAFTKNAAQWYLFPIHSKELANVGLVEDDLVEWITFLNSMRVGFEYLYFGQQPAPTTDVVPSNWRNSTRGNDGIYYWVGMPAFGANALPAKPYLHWICLRYMFNTQVSTMNQSFDKVRRLNYYHIPRITMFLHQEHKLTKVKAFLYAHLASPFYSGYGLCYSDYMLTDTEWASQNRTKEQIDTNHSVYDVFVNLRVPEFKALWAIRTYNGAMNTMLTQSNYAGNDTLRKALPKLKDMKSSYVARDLYQLFADGKYEEFIKTIKDSYKSKVKNGKKKLVNS